MSAGEVTTQYVMAGDSPLSANAGGNTTFYLYGLGEIGEKTDAWSYSLLDGTNTPRQLTDPTGEVTFSARYTPWGDTLETYGDGNFTFGYFGGLMDAATGLLYVGNGQYYDPSTGRFLTRDAKPNGSNPYVPFDPMGMLFAPLGLLAIFYSRRKKVSKWGMWIALLWFVGSVGITLSACQTGDFTATVTATLGSPVGVGTFEQNGTTVTGLTPVSPDGTPLAVPTACLTPTITLTPTGTPMPYPAYSNPNARMFLAAVLKHQNKLLMFEELISV
jgi:RHS repeat-associated protein